MDYAGINLRRYETARYSYFARMSAFLNSIIIPSNAVDFPDVSFYQGTIDWNKMSTKTDAVIIRLGQNTWVDKEFERNYAEAKAKGLKVGGYWFFDGRSSATTQANMIKSLMAGKSFEMELFIDWERNYGGNYEGLKEVVALMQAVESVDCFDVGLYTGYYWFVENSNATTHANQYNYLKNKPLWLAWYASASAVKIPAPWTDWTHWQYGTPSVGHDFGVATVELDMNRHNGDLSRYGAVTPPPGGTMEDKYYEVTASAGLNIRTGAGASFADIGDLVQGDIIHTVMEQAEGGNVWKRFDKIWKNGAWQIPPASPTNEHWAAIVWNSGSWMAETTDPAPPPTTGDPAVMEIMLADGSSVIVRDTAGNELFRWP